MILSPPLETIQLCINKAAKALIFLSSRVYRWSARRAQALALALGSKDATITDVDPKMEETEARSESMQSRDTRNTTAERGPVAALPLSEKHSFFTNISKKRALVKVVLQMTASLTRLHARVEEHLKTFEQFGFLWRKMASEQLAGFINEPGDERFSLATNGDVQLEDKDRRDDNYYVTVAKAQSVGTQKVVDDFTRELNCLSTVVSRIEQVKPVKIIESLAVDCGGLKTNLLTEALRWKQMYGEALADWALDEIRSLQGFLSETRIALEHEVTNLDELSVMMKTLSSLRDLESEIDEKIQPILEAQKILDRFHINVSSSHVDMVLALQDEWQKLKQLAEDCADRLQQLQPIFRRQLVDDISIFKADAADFCNSWKQKEVQLQKTAQSQDLFVFD